MQEALVERFDGERSVVLRLLSQGPALRGMLLPFSNPLLPYVLVSSPTALPYPTLPSSLLFLTQRPRTGLIAGEGSEEAIGKFELPADDSDDVAPGPALGTLPPVLAMPLAEMSDIRLRPAGPT
jgi:hypothetical protein